MSAMRGIANSGATAPCTIRRAGGVDLCTRLFQIDPLLFGHEVDYPINVAGSSVNAAIQEWQSWKPVSTVKNPLGRKTIKYVCRPHPQNQQASVESRNTSNLHTQNAMKSSSQ
jgi:hypothetical protein